MFLVTVETAHFSESQSYLILVPLRPNRNYKTSYFSIFLENHCIDTQNRYFTSHTEFIFRKSRPYLECKNS